MGQSIWVPEQSALATTFRKRYRELVSFLSYMLWEGQPEEQEKKRKF